MGQPITFTSYYQQLVATALGAGTFTATGKLSLARCGSGSTTLSPSPMTNWAATGEGGFTGYAQPATIVWTSWLNEVDMSATIQSPAQLFRVTGASSVTMNNFFIDDGQGISSVTNVGSTSTGIFGSAVISPGRTMVNVGDGFSVTINWNVGTATANSEGNISS